MDQNTIRWDLRPDDDRYPQALLDIEPAAPVLHGIGNREVLAEACLSVIGARKATPYGLAAARMAGRVAAECGVVVVSGGARGCDHEASRAALDSGGRTVIVSGCSADLVYPSSSADIFEGAVATGGAVIALEEWGTHPAKYTFPKRNVIIAALSSCLFVTEAGMRSGTMSTAEAARSMGRSLFVIPGSIFSPTSAGTNRLIADGAQVICDECDLELAISMSYNAPRLVMQGERPDMGDILSALLAGPLRVVELAERTNRDQLTLIRTLSDYEAAGLVVRLPDGRFSATTDAYLGRRAARPT